MKSAYLLADNFQGAEGQEPYIDDFRHHLEKLYLHISHYLPWTSVFFRWHDKIERLITNEQEKYDAQYDSNSHFKALHKTMRQWYEPIIRMWRFSLNNGITEGFHRKMKLILQRRAYGFRNFQNYRLRVLVECSGGAAGGSTLCA